jgi:hypothetical protein
VKAYAVVEPMLNDLIVAVRPRRMPIFGGLAAALAYTEPADEGFQTFVAGLNIGGRVGKVALAKGLGLLKIRSVSLKGSRGCGTVMLTT